jgi:DnaA family protein
MKQLVLDLARLPPPTLDNFVMGRNAELMQNLRRLATRPARDAAERFIYVWGLPGSGRSHLLRGVVATVRAAGASAAYVACAEGVTFAEDAARMDCIAVDDAERLDGAGQVALFNLYNAIREERGTLLISGNAPPVQLAMRPDLVTRLGWGLVYQVHALSDEEKAQALAQHGAGRGFRLSAEVCAYLLQRARRDMPSLLAMLDALDRYSLETKRQITVPLVRELLHAAPDGGKKQSQVDIESGNFKGGD